MPTSSKTRNEIKNGWGTTDSGPITPLAVIFSANIRGLVDNVKWIDEGVDAIETNAVNDVLTVKLANGTIQTIRLAKYFNEAEYESGILTFKNVDKETVKTIDLSAHVLGVDEANGNFTIYHADETIDQFSLPQYFFEGQIDKDEISFTDINGNSLDKFTLPKYMMTGAINKDQLIFVDLDGNQKPLIQLPKYAHSATYESGLLNILDIDGNIIKSVDLTDFVTEISLTQDIFKIGKNDDTVQEIQLPKYVSSAVYSVEADALIFYDIDGNELQRVDVLKQDILTAGEGIKINQENDTISTNLTAADIRVSTVAQEVWGEPVGKNIDLVLNNITFRLTKGPDQTYSPKIVNQKSTAMNYSYIRNTRYDAAGTEMSASTAIEVLQPGSESIYFDPAPGLGYGAFAMNGEVYILDADTGETYLWYMMATPRNGAVTGGTISSSVELLSGFKNYVPVPAEA